MSKIVSFFKSIRLKQILTVFLAGVVLLLNTACTRAQATMPDPGPHPVGQNQPYKGGMNNFEDAAPGAVVEGTPDKVKALVDNAERNLTSDDPRDANPRNNELIKNPGKAVERTKDTLGDAITTRANNVKEEAKKVGDRVAGTGERAAEKTKEIGDRIGKGAQNVTDNVVPNSVDNTVENTKQSAKAAAKDVTRAAKKAID